MELEKDEIRIIKDKKELYEFLDLPEEYFCENMSESILNQINKAKSKERSSIPTYLWSKNKYAESNCLEKILGMYKDNKNTIDRVNIEDITLEEFREKYEKKKIPCIIKGISKKWKESYSFEWRVK